MTEKRQKRSGSTGARKADATPETANETAAALDVEASADRPDQPDLSAADAKSPHRPRDWETAVTAAGLRAAGRTQAETAEVVGMSERQIRGWEKSHWWPDAVEEAVEDALGRAFSAAAFGALALAKAGDPNIVKFLLERADPKGRFMPPQVNLHLQAQAEAAQAANAPTVFRVTFGTPKRARPEPGDDALDG